MLPMQYFNTTLKVKLGNMRIGRGVQKTLGKIGKMGSMGHIAISGKKILLPR